MSTTTTTTSAATAVDINNSNKNVDDDDKYYTSSSSSSSSSSSPPVVLDCVIVGAGITGLSVAHALLPPTQHHHHHHLHPHSAADDDVAASSPKVINFIVTEAGDRAGGNITTMERHGYLWEEGPNSFQPSDSILTMLVDCGLKDDLVLGDPDAPRFVFWDGQLRPVPSHPSHLPFFDLMSLAGKLRAAFGALGFRPPPPRHEESVEDFVRRNLGDEVFERLIEPFCSGVYAGDPSKLSMKAAFGKVWNLEQDGGSIVTGAFKAIQKKASGTKKIRDPRLPFVKGQTVGSLRKGLSMLPDAITARLGSKLKLSWKLSGIVKLENEVYSLTFETPRGPVSLQSQSVVMTVPSYVASSLLRPLSDAAAEALSKFYYPPIAAVSISYPKEAIRAERLRDGELKGFGQLHPRNQGVETLGTIYSSSLFPNRAPSGRILLLNYVGGATNPEILSKMESQLVEVVDRDLRKMLIKSDAEDPLVLGVRVWSEAIPQFLVGHFDILDAAKAALRNGRFEGIFLGGNYVSGVALGRCVEGAYEVAAEVTNFLSQRVVYK